MPSLHSEKNTDPRIANEDIGKAVRELVKDVTDIVISKKEVFDLAAIYAAKRETSNEVR